MQIRMRCFKCQTPFVLKNDEIKAALETVHSDNLKHYNSSCPKCGRANKVSKNQLKKAIPNWEPPSTPGSEE